MKSTDRALRVVVAPDSFKGSLDARSAADAIATGWRSVRSGDELVQLPQADGGEGTLDAVAASVPGAEWRVRPDLVGPDGRSRSGRWLMLPNGTAVVELAEISGLPLMEHLDPIGATSAGLGQLIVAAIEDGAKRLVIGLGGSASTDGGAGALRAMGARITDCDGVEIEESSLALRDASDVDVAALIKTPAGGVEILTDTRAVLCGAGGAAHLFGRQKGADAHTREQLDQALERFAVCLARALPEADPDEPGSGAAGGVGFALSAWGGHLRSGAQRIGDITGLTAAIPHADVVVTGEGSFDITSATGKLVGHVLGLCAQDDARSVVIAGQLNASPPDLGVSLTDLAGSSARAQQEVLHFATLAGRAAAELITGG